jgi:hypothetical protein
MSKPAGSGAPAKRKRMIPPTSPASPSALVSSVHQPASPSVVVRAAYTSAGDTVAPTLCRMSTMSVPLSLVVAPDSGRG